MTEQRQKIEEETRKGIYSKYNNTFPPIRRQRMITINEMGALPGEIAE